MVDVAAARRFASTRLAELADPERATGMAAYLKSEMPFYGVTKPERVPIARELARRWVPANQAEYRALVEGLWSLPHREEKYLALGVARAHTRFIALGSVPLYRRLIVDGAWWDLVDETAIHLAGGVLKRNRDRMTRSSCAG